MTAAQTSEMVGHRIEVVLERRDLGASVIRR